MKNNGHKTDAELESVDATEELLVQHVIEYHDALLRGELTDCEARTITSPTDGTSDEFVRVRSVLQLLARGRTRWRPAGDSTFGDAFETACEVECPRPVDPADQPCNSASIQDHTEPLPHEQPSAESVGAAECERNSPARLGRFSIERELGRGGLGVVFLAFDPVLERQVALKVPRPEVLITADVRARFEREARAAARLSHPNLVPVHEVGHAGAVVFLVSEYCPGTNLASWLASRQAPVESLQAAHMVRDLARAVEYAHEHGVLHRDIKPTNVLLEAHQAGHGKAPTDLVPKLTDFGLAKLLDATNDATHTGTVLGTPGYMAPEQARGENLDRRTDVYSLGVLLFEMLAGEPPFRGTPPMLLQKVIHNEPRTPRSLNDNIPRDVETIILKAMAKDPAHRYQTARELADDLGRFLGGEAILARPISSAERLWRWTRRNRVVATLGATLLTLLGLMAVGSTAIAVRMANLARNESAAKQEALRSKAVSEQAVQEVTQERDRKEVERLKAIDAERRATAEATNRQSVSQFLTQLFEASDTIGMQGFGIRLPQDGNAELTASEMLRRGATRLESELKDQPLVRAQLLSTIGRVTCSMGNVMEAANLLEQARQLQVEHGAPPLALAETLYGLAWAQQLLAHYSESVALNREALRIRREILGDKNLLVAESMFNLAWALEEKDHGRHPEEAEALFTEVLAVRRQLLPANHRDIAFALSAMAAVRLENRDAQGALPYLMQAALIFMQQPGGEKLGKALVGYQRAAALRRRRMFDRAEEQYREAIQLLRDFFQGDHPVTALVVGDLAGLLKETRQYDKAEAAIREAIAMGRRIVPRGHPQLIMAMQELAQALVSRGEHDEGLAFSRESIAMSRSLYGEGSIEHVHSMSRAAMLMVDGGAYAEALETANKAVDIVTTNSGVQSDAWFDARGDLARVFEGTEKYDEAEEVLRGLLSRHIDGCTCERCVSARLTLAEVLVYRSPGSTEAESMIRGVVAGRMGKLKSLSEYELHLLGLVLLDQGRYDEAEPVLRENLVQDIQIWPTGDWRIANAESLLGACLAGESKNDEAEPLLVSGYQGLLRARGPQDRMTLKGRTRLRDFYRSTGRSDKVEALEP